MMPDNDPNNAPGRKKWRIKFGFLESFILIFLTFAGVGFLYEYNKSQDTAEHQAKTLFLQSTQSVQQKLQHIQDAIKAVLYTSRAYHDADLLTAANIQAANTIFLAHMQQYPFMTSINFGDGAGNGYLLLHTEKENKNRIKKAGEVGRVTWLTLDQEGKILASQESEDDYDPRTRPWFKNSIRYHDIVWSAPYPFLTTGDIGITASLGLNSKDGHNEVVGIDIKLKDLSDFLAGLISEKGVTAYLLDVDNTIIASSDHSSLSSRLQQKEGALPRIGVGDFPFIDGALKTKKEESPFWSFQAQGQDYLAMMEPVSLTPHGRFNLLLTVPREVFFGHFLQNSLLQLTITLLLLMAASGWYIIRYLLPLRRVERAVQEFGEGKFTRLKIKTSRNDEIGDLAAHFIAMTQALKNREELLRQSDQRLIDIGDNLPESYIYQYQYEADDSVRFLYISAGVESVHGVSREEVLGDAETLIQQIPTEERRRLLTAEKSHQDELTDFQTTVSFRRSDGEERWLLLRSRPQRQANGQVVWDGVATDITKRRRIEDALLQQTEFTKSLIESLVPAAIVLDAQHHVVIWNRACTELTGVAAATMLGTDDQWQAFYDHPRPCLADIALDSGYVGLAEHYETYAPSPLVAQGLHAEGWYKNLHGHDRYLSFDAAPVYDRAGNLLAAIETIADRTAEKRGEESLHLQSAALQAAANAIVITARDGAIVWVNPAFTELTGYSAEETIGKNPGQLVKSGLHDQAFYKDLWETLLRGELWRGEIINRHKDGTLYPEGQTITPVRDKRGFITHFIAIKRDLREQRKLEEQLRQSQKMEAIGTLAGGIAHDFNNILTAISGYGQLTLMKLKDDDPLRYNIASILDGVERATRLTQQMLMFSRKQVSHKKIVDVNTIIIHVGKFLNKVIGEDITIHTALAPEPLSLLADDHQLEQVMMNLATNAGHAMPQGGTLTVTTEKVELDHTFMSTYGYGTPGPFARIIVADTGIGMDSAIQAKIFEPFFTTKEVSKGTGLGLAVVYGIIKNHEGYINVSSEPGKGSSFSIYLPLSFLPQEEIIPQRDNAISGGTETILLAEDDTMVREMTRDMLTEFGYTVMTAEDGSEAVGKFSAQSDTIDLLLFDLIMPRMNGQEAFDEIRKLRPGIKIIFFSGYAPEIIHQKVALTAGAHLLAKPTAPKKLLQLVRKVLDEGSPGEGQR